MQNRPSPWARACNRPPSSKLGVDRWGSTLATRQRGWSGWRPLLVFPRAPSYRQAPRTARKREPSERKFDQFTQNTHQYYDSIANNRPKTKRSNWLISRHIFGDYKGGRQIKLFVWMYSKVFMFHKLWMQIFGGAMNATRVKIKSDPKQLTLLIYN